MNNKYMLYLSGLISENQLHEAKGEETKNYMFFSNLKTIKERVDAMLAMDQAKVDALITDGHDWASDHIATSKDDVEEVYNWLNGAIKK